MVQSAALSAPRLDAEAVGTFSVMTGVVVPLATVEERSVPVVPKVSAATDVTVPPPPLAVELMVWLGQVPVMVTLVPATKAGVAVPVPPDATAKIEDKPAAVPEVFWFKVGNVQFAKLPEDGVPKAPPEVSLLLNVVQSAELKYPLALAVATGMLITGVVVPVATATGAVPVTEVTVPPPLPAPIAVLNAAASKVVTVLSALICMNVTALGLASVNRLPPTVVEPKDVRAAEADVAPVPPEVSGRAVPSAKEAK